MTGRVQAARVRPAAVAGLECVAAVALSTVVVAALDAVTSVTSLGVVYLLAVLFVAIRRGQMAATATALLGVLTLNFFFIEPRHHLTISDPDNLVALIVLLVAALAVGRLATAERQRAAEAEQRAQLASAREREAAMLAAAASSLLEGGDATAQLRSIERSGATGSRGAGGMRIALEHAPAPEADEVAVALPTSGRRAWLYIREAVGWEPKDRDRVAKALARLLDVAFERERVAAQSAEAEATRRADIAKTAILHAISHDLRSPLTAITTAASALGDEKLSTADRSELVSVVKGEAARLSRLVDDLLDLSRIEAGAVDPTPDWCDLRDVTFSAAAQVRALRGDFPIEFDLPAELPLVRADPAQLERVFANLIENAARFSPGGTPVRVTGGVAGDRVVLRVSDRGRGVPRSERTRIFEPFVRGRDAGPGSGLGLAICRGFVQANGGRILLQTGAGDETSFAVSFAVVPQPTPA